ncbi:hypothetical protein VNI00_013593 [Paramarasmius palmivorus]|uniref:C2H2-type domain-containing protein n=1 Tax=Paramarasmius palmivorus TaxID=297713 RepID=A0AAW0BXG4_9AGAR
MRPVEFRTYRERGIEGGNPKPTWDRLASEEYIDGQGYGYTQEYELPGHASHTPSSQESDTIPQTFLLNQITSPDLQNNYRNYHGGAEAIAQVTGQNSSPAYHLYAATQNGQPPGYSSPGPGLASFQTQLPATSMHGPQYFPPPTTTYSTSTRESQENDKSWPVFSAKAPFCPEHADGPSEIDSGEDLAFVSDSPSPTREPHEPHYRENRAGTISTVVRNKVASPGVLAASKARRTGKQASYRCPHCDSTFTSSHNLQSHIRAHLGVRPYPCVGCQRGFGTKSDMKRHEKTCKSRQADS